MSTLSLGLLLGAGAPLVVVALAWTGFRRLANTLEPELGRAWRRVVGKLGLTDVAEERPFFGPPSLSARSRQLTVRLDKVAMDTEVGTRITVSGLGPAGEVLEVRVAGGERLFERPLFERDVELGSPVFDAQFLIVGPAPLALAVLDWESRSMLKELLRGRLSVPGDGAHTVEAQFAAGQLEVSLRHPPKARQGELEPPLSTVLQGVLDLAHRLAAPADRSARWAANFVAEPEVGLRKKLLRLLVAEAPENPARRTTLSVALEDTDEEIRLEAAAALGREGHPTLRALLDGPTTSQVVAARAVEALGAALSLEEATKQLQQALRRDRGEIAVACLETLERHGRLGRRGDAALERQLLILAARQTSDVALAAARALGPLGTTESVAALRRLESEGPREIARLARQAVAEIQARQTGAEQGQLSLASADAGGLSLAEERGVGRLSLAEEGKG